MAWTRRSDRALPGRRAPAPPSGTVRAWVRPARALAGADGGGARRRGQPLPGPPPAGGAGARQERMGRIRSRPGQAHVRAHRRRPRGARSVGRVAGRDPRPDRPVPRTTSGREVTMHPRRSQRRRPPLGARFYATDNVLERLDEYQRDLEQELADVTELIKRLREGEAPHGRPEPQM